MKSVEPSELLKSWGEFKEQDIPLSALGENNAKSIMIFNEVAGNKSIAPFRISDKGFIAGYGKRCFDMKSIWLMLMGGQYIAVIIIILVVFTECIDCFGYFFTGK